MEMKGIIEHSILGEIYRERGRNIHREEESELDSGAESSLSWWREKVSGWSSRGATG